MFLAQSREKHAGKDAVHCKDGCSAVQGRMQCTARADAVHCGSGCSALRLRWPQKVPKSSVHFLDISTETILVLRTYIIYTYIIYMYNYRRRVHPRKKLLRTSSVPYTEKVRRGEGETTGLWRKCQRPTAATSSSGPSNCCSPDCIFLSITLP